MCTMENSGNIDITGAARDGGEVQCTGSSVQWFSEGSGGGSLQSLHPQQ